MSVSFSCGNAKRSAESKTLAESKTSASIEPQEESALRLLYWNIQNGMWSDQENGYDRFVDWVKAQDPDICVWCEAQSIYNSGTADKMPAEDRYLPEHWGELAARYGHHFWAIGGYRDSYPQVVTSKFPIATVSTITGAQPDSIVTHGAGWFRIQKGGNTFNIVTLHLWPMNQAFGAPDIEESRKENGGDKYRRTEIQYICERTILSESKAASQLWMMMGDFNSRTRRDNFFLEYPDNDSRFLVHDYIAGFTPYIDTFGYRYPGQYFTTTGGKARIDYVYCTKPLFDSIISAEVISDSFTTPVRDPQNLSNFWHPSDHRPILINFSLTH